MTRRVAEAPGKPGILFYGGFPIGYHNPEGEIKARAFAANGYHVVYASGVGIRDPRVATLGKAAAVVAARIGRGRLAGDEGDVDAHAGELDIASPLVLPPRRALRRLNGPWLERQIRPRIDDWSEAVAWIRFPSPELVDVLGRLAPRAIVYECVDAHHLTSGITGPWATLFEDAERRLVERADVVIAPNEHLAGRFRGRGVPVQVVPHGVDLFDWHPRSAGAGPPTLGFVGTLDFRLDTPLLRYLAEARPGWRMRLVGPLQPGFDRDDLADLPNVSVEPAVPYERLGETLASFDVGLMPYRDDSFFRHMSPVKNLELLAAGRPAVGRRNPALEPFAESLYFATTPKDFVAQVERSLAEDSPELARRRREVAEANTWESRLVELRALLTALRDRTVAA